MIPSLPDILSPELRLLSVGLNPSLPSVEAGYYFANPRNRFWRALNASNLLQAPLEPGKESMRIMLQRDGIGFTDLVKRPTRGAADLRAADYRRGAARLLDLIRNTQTGLMWFHGKLAYSRFVQYSHTRKHDIVWGLQSHRVCAKPVFVTPNPSPANAAYSLDDLIKWYDRLGDLVDKVRA